MWKLALPMAAANITGGYVGARVAVARGARFVRIFFLVVVVRASSSASAATCSASGDPDLAHPGSVQPWAWWARSTASSAGIRWSGSRSRSSTSSSTTRATTWRRC